MDYIGIDMHKKESQICILAEGGELIERRIRMEPGRFAEVLGERLRAPIVIEASTDSEWVAARGSASAWRRCPCPGSCSPRWRPCWPSCAR
jgi:hypothetical protein